MKRDEVQKKMESAILDNLKGSGLGPQEGVAAMMGAVLGVLDSVATLTRQPNKNAFMKAVLYQCINQL